MAEIERMFLSPSLDEPTRLVTLTGVGGVGKTRVALTAAAALQPRFRDGVWLVELSPLREQGALLAHVIAEALPLADQTTRPMIEVLAEYLCDRELLLVLDTCEHLTGECALVVEALLKAAPGLRVLATSRRVLNAAGERVLTVEPLPVPEVDDARAGTADAVVLLTLRATEAVPGFTVTDADRADLVRLCRRLDGLPLAIELAAARLRDLPVRELTARLDDRFAVLGDTHGVTDAEPPWHQALRTAIGWSHQLCTPAERLLWARLSVFVGSFDVETVRQVCADGHFPAEQIPAVLGTLVEKSILVWQPTGGGERYRMLDTIREYGAHWLRGLGEDDVLRRRHRDHYLDLARRGDAAWTGPDQFAWYDRMTAEHDNLRAALDYCLAEPEGHIALEMAAALWFFWFDCGVLKEGRHYLDQALAADTAPSPVRVKALYACGLLLISLGDLPALEERAAECTALAAHFGVTERSYAAATQQLRSALRGDEVQPVPRAEAHPATDGRAAPVTFIPLVALALVAQSHVFIAGRPEDAFACLDELSTACDRIGERSLRAWGNWIRAQAEMALGRFHEAHEHARAALLVKHRLREGVGSGMVLEVLAHAAGATGRHTEAAWLLGLATQLWETLGRPQAGIPAAVAAHQVCERRTREALGEDVYQHAFDAGYTIDLDTGIAQALNPASTPLS
ncbi:hypothetical protein ABZ921_08605 [Streptomyces atriruber]|uniref:Winged helix-turn-helix domain-containing protein n=1 Tax=Streptomyces atriruber TaxID=545121 RepID=A0ABV3BI42_9ACTN